MWGVAWNLSTGLYWICPWDFPTLDSQSRSYISKRLGIPINPSSQQGPCNATGYLGILDALESRFTESNYPVHSFPELSLEAWLYKDPGTVSPVAHETDLNEANADHESDE